MRTRFCATMRKPALSMIALIAPVRLRLVASGLMIEKVRSTAIGHSSFFREGSEGRRLIAAGFPSGKAERPFSPHDTLYLEPTGAHPRLPLRMTESQNPRRTA